MIESHFLRKILQANNSNSWFSILFKKSLTNVLQQIQFHVIEFQCSRKILQGNNSLIRVSVFYLFTKSLTYVLQQTLCTQYFPYTICY